MGLARALPVVCCLLLSGGAVSVPSPLKPFVSGAYVHVVLLFLT